MSEPSITPEQMKAYRASARRQNLQRRERSRLRHQLGLRVAHQAAELLKTEFKAEQVALFGSMLSPDRVHERSDVDLAVWGLDPNAYFRAVGRLQSLEPSISIDLVEVDEASPRLVEEILTTGVKL